MADTAPEPISPRARYAGIALAVLAVALNLALAALLIFDLVRAHENPGDYPFGAENAGWSYRSLESYTASGAIKVAILAAGIVAVLFVRSWLLRLVLGYIPIPLLILGSGLWTL